MRPFNMALGVVCVAVCSSVAAHAPYATQITPDSASQLVRSGPDAIGGVNDWFLSNGTLCAIVSDISREGEFSASGGSLVDLGYCGRADDHFSFTHDLLQGSRLRPLDGAEIKTEQTQDGSASIVVISRRDGAEMRTRYSMDTLNPTQLRIRKRLSFDASAPDAEEFGFFSSLNFNYHSLEPFVFDSQQWSNSNGFQNEDFVSRGESAMSVAARSADTIITISPPDAEAGISYGWQIKSAERVTAEERYPVPRFVLADDSSNALLVLTDTFYIGDGSKLGWLQLPQILLLDLDDAVLETEEVIYVGPSGDVASITDQIFSEQPLVSGRINETNVAIHVVQANGAPLTHTRPDESGAFSLRLPQGNYTLQFKGTADRTIDKELIVANENLELGEMTMPKPARLKLPEGEAMRLVFQGLNGTDDPDFASTLTGSSVVEEDGVHFQAPVPQIFLAGVTGDRTEVELAPGEYRVYATRGPEFSLESTRITIKAESSNVLSISIPKQVIKTPGYIASDLHVHSGVSFDNTFSEQERVRTFVAEHGEVMVSSEHDVPVDYAPRIKALGVQDKIVSIAAAEVTSLLPSKLNPYSNGHANFFPYPPEATEFRRGMVNHEDRRWRDIIHELKHKHPHVVSQLNHPRLNMELSGEELPADWKDIVDNGQFLDHMGSAGHPYNPHKPLTEFPNNVLIEPDPVTGVRDIDFDLIEVINPGGEHHHDRIKAVRQDWLSLLKQGERLVATANSDSHRSNVQVAVPRTMVAVKDDRISAFDQSEFLSSLKGGNVYGTTGPMLELSLGGAPMGGTFKGQRGQLSLTITSADWIPVDRARIQINGETVGEYTFTEESTNSLLIPMSFEKDSFVTVEVSGPVNDGYKAVYPELTPYAFSNPIYVDYNSDGEWHAPGL